MKLRTQLIATMLFFGIALLIISASIITTNQQADRLKAQGAIAKDIELKANELGYLSSDYLLSRETTQLDRWESKYSALSADITGLSPDNPEEQALVSGIITDGQRLEGVFGQIVAGTENTTGELSPAIDPAALKLSWSRLAVQDQGLILDASRLTRMLSDREDQLEHTSNLLIFLLMGTFSLFLLANYLLFYRRTLALIANLRAGTRIVGSGNFEYAFIDGNDDEIGELSRAFNQMAVDLKTVTASKQDLEREIAYRRRVEDALTTAHRQITQHVENSPLAIIEFDARFRIILWSGDAARIFGWTAGEVMGKAIGEFPWVYEEDAERVTRISADMLSGKSARNMHANRNYRKDGSVIECEWYNSALRDEKGELVSIFSQVLDVTARNRAEAEIEEKIRSLNTTNEELSAAHEELQQNVEELTRAEGELRESEERLRALYGSMTEGVAIHEMIYDKSGKPSDYRILTVNPAFSHVTGITREQAEGTLASALYGTGKAPYIETYARVAETGVAEVFETAFESMGKSFRISVFSPEKGRFATVFMDITGRKRTEANQALMRDVLRVLNLGGELHSMTREILRIIRDSTGFDAVGLRMRNGEEFPYFEQNGFSEEFLREEDFLCVRHGDGRIVRDANGQTVLECTCGLVISGRTDPAMPCFTDRGSFWTNKSSELLALPIEADPRTNPRNRCIHDGYQSVALIPVRSGSEIIGLLQLNDRAEGRFTPGLVRFFENLGENIGLALRRQQAEGELEQKNLALNAANEELQAIHEELTKNIDETKKSEQALRETTQYLENLISSANAPIIVWDPEFRITRFNRAFEELTGRSAESVIGRKLEILFPPSRKKELMNLIRRTLTGEHWENAEIPIEDTGRKVHTVLWNSATMYKPDGTTVLSVIAQGQDITRRKRAEAKNRQARAEWERTFNTVPDLIAVLDRDHRIVRMNQAMADRLKTTPEKCIGLLCHEVVHGSAHPPAFCPHVASCNDGAQHIAEVHEPNLGGDFLVSTTPLCDAEGRITGTVHVARDITEEKRIETELLERNVELNSMNEELIATQEELQRNVDELAKSEAGLRKNETELKETLKEKDVLLSEIHHRVKNNLAAFISLLSLEGTYEETPEGQALKKDLQNRARSMALIHETLYRTRSYANVDMGVYLKTLMEQIAGSYKSAKPVNVVVDADGVVIDISRATPCGLIINELVTNSFKYAFPASFDCEKERHEPCTIRVSMRKGDGMYILSIGDNGIGLPAGFDIKSAQSLGLKLVSFLARHQLRAKIEAGSEKGTEFIITFKDVQ